MDPHRKLWNERHQKLTRALAAGERAAAITLFLDQHAMVHSAKATRSKLWSFEDELLDGLSEQEMRQIPPGGEHSIAWILLHLARIEDIVMNMLIAGELQLFTAGTWAEKLNISLLHSANRMPAGQIAELSAAVDLAGLRAYRAAVARRTRRIVQALQAEDFRKKVEPARIEAVLREGAVTPEAVEITDYWGKKTVAGLLLMPPTRHCLLHLNEGMRMRGKMR